jgi:hypothetical protein
MAKTPSNNCTKPSLSCTQRWPPFFGHGYKCVLQPEGSYSDAAIHEQIMAGVEDSDLRQRTRRKLIAADKDRLIPEKLPNQL